MRHTTKCVCCEQQIKTGRDRHFHATITVNGRKRVVYGCEACGDSNQFDAYIDTNDEQAVD